MKTTAQIFKALGDETRLRIMALLIKGRELCVCDIMAALEIPQSTASRHLSYLRNADLVDDRRQGGWMYYTLRNANMHSVDLFSLLAGMFTGSKQIVADSLLLQKHLESKNQQTCS